MMPQAVLIEILERIGANNGAATFISNQELSEWPSDLITSMKSHGLITSAPPATNTVCPGCERSCFMPVVYQINAPTAFIVCDKRSDTNRVSIPPDHIERWQASGCSLSKLLAKLLELPVPVTNTSNSCRWEIGVFRGSKHSNHLVLTADSKLVMLATGHQLALDELLTYVNGTFKIDRRKIIRAVDNPALGGGDTESFSQRQKRIKDRVATLKRSGIKAFLKKVAAEEGVCVSRIKQIVYDNKSRL
jgi:hypothetical protein